MAVRIWPDLIGFMDYRFDLEVYPVFGPFFSLKLICSLFLQFLIFAINSTSALALFLTFLLFYSSLWLSLGCSVAFVALVWRWYREVWKSCFILPPSSYRLFYSLHVY